MLLCEFEFYQIGIGSQIKRNNNSPTMMNKHSFPGPPAPTLAAGETAPTKEPHNKKCNTHGTPPKDVDMHEANIANISEVSRNLKDDFVHIEHHHGHQQRQNAPKTDHQRTTSPEANSLATNPNKELPSGAGTSPEANTNETTQAAPTTTQ
jgi:hypothetical protein